MDYPKPCITLLSLSLLIHRKRQYYGCLNTETENATGCSSAVADNLDVYDYV